jgi:hypothetical protein
LTALIAAVWIWIDRLLGNDAQRDAGTAQYLGKLNVALGLFLISGILGVANGAAMAYSGRRNWPLIAGVVIAFAAGLFVAISASSGYRPP